MCSEQETAVAGDRDDGTIGVGDFHAERGSIAVAEVLLVAARHVGARFIHRETKASREARLADLFDEEAVVGQHLTDDVQVGQLRLHDLVGLASSSARSIELVSSRGPRLGAFAQRVE